MVASLSALCGQLLVVGIADTRLTDAEESMLRSGERGGVVLFKRNLVPGEMPPLLALTHAIHAACPDALVAIDQEGGRVVRIAPPALALPPMRRVGDLGDLDLAERLAEAQARELAALGITMSFAPVADIHTRAENPIIGDRAFSESPAAVARFARAWSHGLDRGGVLTCLKHFPGHGDTTTDSHLALPRVERAREGLDAIELVPFRELARDPAVHSMMSAHVVYAALDPRPATLSHAICTDLLRGELGFEGVLFSDDLEMKAIQLPAAESAVLAISAGCDSLLVCSRADMAEEAHAALVREAESSPAFRARCEEAHARFITMRARHRFAAVADESALAGVFERSRAVADELAARVRGAS